MKSEEIKPCPFCNQIPTINTNWDDAWGDGDTECVLSVECENDICPAIKIGEVKPEDWNNRPIEDALLRRIAELERNIP